ncbi:MAG: 1-acyl-sn-glycerol-3-phosphate acyltransferase [Clostridia bacterium]|nr:1-acyl-sn-glycerol-3-phosphate acyltransferase [Clostridia bacterium]
MKKSFVRFDMSKHPISTRWFLRPVTYLLSAPDVKKHAAKITKTGVEGLKPPYILLCNHNAFMDFKVATKAIYPQRANYIVAIDGFIGREWLLRNVGCICKRKFTSDILLLRQMKRALAGDNVLVIYPEARYSLCGTTAVLPESLGACCKMMNVPVVTLICHGHHVNSPFWNLHDRGVKPTEAEMKLLYTAEELKKASADEVNAKIVDAFRYDDFAWQKERGIRTPYKGRAEGLHRVLYKCPECETEFRMASEGTELFCKCCGKRWTMSELGELAAIDGNTRFSHIPDWYEWERECVKKEIVEGSYSSGALPVHVNTLPNAKKFYRLGNGTMIHDMNGFTVKGTDTDGDPFEMIKSVPSLYSCHIEYNYLGKHGDCVDLNTLEDTWYIYPECENFSVTKMALATEELYFDWKRKQGRECKPGLA